MGKTYLLFDSHGSYSVGCDLYATPKGYARRDDAHIVSGDNEDFEIAARKATYNVHKEAEKRGVAYKPCSVGFELLERINSKRNIAGESGGLAFIVAFSQKLMKKDMGNIAATGVIEENGKIGAVKGIQSKLEAALNLLQSNDTIFYPERNKKDIPESVKESIKEKNIKLIGISDVSNLFDVLFKAELSSRNTKKNIKLLIGAVTALLIAAGVYYYTLKSSTSTNRDPAKIKQPVIEKKADPVKTIPVKTIPTETIPADDKGFS